MRNVAKRMMNGELAQGVIIWHENQVTEKRERESRERGERIMKRVGGRWRNQEVALNFQEWRMKQVEERDRERGERIMKRVGGRWRNQEVAMNWQEWYTNFKADRDQMWKNRFSKLETELEAMNLKFRMVTQVCIASGMLLRSDACNEEGKF